MFREKAQGGHAMDVFSHEGRAFRRFSVDPTSMSSSRSSSTTSMVTSLKYPSRIPVRRPSTGLMSSRVRNASANGLSEDRMHFSMCSRTPGPSKNSSTSARSSSTSDSDSRQSTDSRLSRSSLHFDLGSEYALSTSIDAQLQRLSISQANPYPVYYLTLSLATLSEHIVIATLQSKAWICGWSPRFERKMPNTLHTGDQIVEIDGEECTEDARGSIYRTAVPGTPIRLGIRRQPLALFYDLVKPINPAKWNLGIVLHKHKNRVECIEEDSISSRRGVPSLLPSFTDPSILVTPVITDVNGTRLNLWARNDQFFRILDTVRDGTEFRTTIQPHDFIKALKHAMKAQHKCYKAYCGPD